jgi:hypothetical protein
MNRLITKSIHEESVHLLFGFPRKLMSRGETEMVEWVLSYVSKHGKPPTIERFTNHFDTFLPMLSNDPLTDIYEVTLTKKRNHYARSYLMEIQENLKDGEDPVPYIERLHNDIKGGDGGVVRYTTFDRSAYYRDENSIPYGIPQMDKYTGGVSKGDLIYLIGRLGTGKTTFALWILLKWLLQDKRILMVSNENRAEDVIGKIDSFLGGFNPLKKRTKEWTDEDRSRVSTVSFIANNMAGEVFIPKRPVQGVDEIRKLSFTYNPDLIIIDGIYLIGGMSGDSHWEKITAVSRELKQLAESEEKPVVGIHQANRSATGKRIEVEHVAYADALAQDADLLLGINPEEDGSLFVEAIKNRWGSKNWGFFMRFFFDTMSVRVLDPKLAVETE